MGLEKLIIWPNRLLLKSKWAIENISESGSIFVRQFQFQKKSNKENVSFYENIGFSDENEVMEIDFF